MKKTLLLSTLLILLTVSVIFILPFYMKNDQEKMQDAVQSYLNENLNDPSSYESVSFSSFVVMTDTTNGEKRKFYHINHKYRAKNKLGALILTEKEFVADKNFKIISGE